MPKNRNYSCKDVDMLMASKTIVEAFKLNLPGLSSVRTIWNEEFAKQLDTKIDYAIENYLGLDKKKELRNATANLLTVQLPAIRDLSFIKKQLEVDFATDKAKLKEILKSLGFGKDLRKIQNNNQEALIELLYAFKNGMKGTLKSDIVAKGVNPELISRIITYADKMKSANVSQEMQKEITKTLSGEAAKAFNEIYTEIIGICKIASSFYQNDVLKKEQFTFKKVLRNMNTLR